MVGVVREWSRSEVGIMDGGWIEAREERRAEVQRSTAVQHHNRTT